MKLYFSPLACSLASRIAAYEAGADMTFIEIDPPTKKTLDGLDYRRVTALGLVPALVTDDGDMILENAAILQHIAELYPARRLAPVRCGCSRSRPHPSRSAGRCIELDLGRSRHPR